MTEIGTRAGERLAKVNENIQNEQNISDLEQETPVTNTSAEPAEPADQHVKTQTQTQTSPDSM